MKKPGYYSSGEFARMAHVTLRTIRYYDKHDILKPTWVSESAPAFIPMKTSHGSSRFCCSNISASPWKISAK